MTSTPPPLERRSRRRPLAFVLATVGVALAIVAVRVVVDARAALGRARGEAQSGQHEAAIANYLEAARAYVPANPYSEAAFADLVALADQARRDGNAGLERRALEAFRAAALGARSLYTPQAARLPAIEARLAALMAAAERAHRGARPAALARTQAWHARKLAVRPGPPPARVIMALAGFLLWTGAVVLFILRGLGPTLRVERGAAAVSGAAFVVGVTLFVLGLSA